MKLAEHLKYRRQFVFSNRAFEFISDWVRFEFKEAGYTLYSHPDLEFSHGRNQHKGITLVMLGFAFDHTRKELTNQQIVDDILAASETVEGVVKKISRLAGRHVFILSMNGQVYMMHDPAGLRSVYYTYQDNVFVAGSQPLIINEVIPLQKTENHRLYIESKHYKENIEYWMPCGLTLYENTKQLLPNHYLHVDTLEQIRFWPDKKIAPQDYKAIAEDGGQMLRDLIEAANNRYKLALAVTAGFDSRSLLAASRDIASDIYLYTMVYYKLNDGSPDVRIPSSMLRKFNLQHNILNCHKEVDPAFLDLIKSNVDLAHPGYATISHGIMEHFPKDHLVVKGSVSEIARCSLYRSGRHAEVVKGMQLAADWKEWEELPFISDYLDKWVHANKQLCLDSNIDIFDLWYLEVFMGNWQAQNQLEKDIVHDVFSPYSYRPLIEIMLGVDIRYRLHDDPVLHKTMIRNMWPQLLNPRWPVNPHPYRRKNRLKYRMAGIFYDWGVYELAKKFYPKL